MEVGMIAQLATAKTLPSDRTTEQRLNAIDGIDTVSTKLKTKEPMSQFKHSWFESTADGRKIGHKQTQEM
jgi:hypothetical protein